MLSPVGIIVYGQCIAHKTTWVGPAFGYAMFAFGFTAISNIAITYVVDSYQALAGEALVTVFVVRNVIALVCSLYSNKWIAQEGIATVCRGQTARFPKSAWLTLCTGNRSNGWTTVGTVACCSPALLLQ